MSKSVEWKLTCREMYSLKCLYSKERPKIHKPGLQLDVIKNIRVNPKKIRGRT